MKRLQKCLIVLSALCLINISAVTHASAQHFELLYPQDGDIIFAKDVHVIARVFDTSAVEIVTKGKRKTIANPVEMKNKDKPFYMVMSTVRLQRGANVIQLLSKSEKIEFKVIFQPAAEAYRDKVDKKSLFHMDEKSKVCSTCHIFNSRKDCMICHAVKAEGKYVHGPAAAWQCSTCHDTNNFNAAAQPPVKKCLQCHKEFTDKMYAANFAHGPTVAGYCNICHTPHASQERYLLQDDVNTLCQNCHDDKKSGTHILSGFMGGVHPTSKRRIPGTNEEISCVSCHNPHYGKTKSLFVDDIKDFAKLCKRCHSDKF